MRLFDVVQRIQSAKYDEQMSKLSFCLLYVNQYFPQELLLAHTEEGVVLISIKFLAAETN